MALTPEDVSNKRFTPVRLREGYDMGEVDQFLDEVEAELARLHEELYSLRRGAASPPTSTAPAAATGDQEGPAGPATPAEPSATPEPAASVQPATAPAPAAGEGTTSSTVSGPGEQGGVETIRVATVSEASGAAARLLELATRSADQLLDEARTDAERRVGEARTEADRLETEAQQTADRTESEARSRAEMLDSETAERRTQLFGDLETEREALGAEVEDLRSFEREYRSRLKAYFHQQLESLEGEDAGGHTPAAPTGQAADTPGRAPGLRSILGDDQD